MKSTDAHDRGWLLTSSTFAVLAALCFAVSCRPPERAGREEASKKASEAPAYPVGGFAAPDLLSPDRTVSSEEAKGKVVLLDFWATWCPPCRSELPALNRLYSEYAGRGVEIIGMTVDMGEPAAIAAKVRQLGVQYPTVLAGSDIQQTFGGIRVVPTKFLLDKEGKIRKFYQGVVSEQVLRNDIESLLAL